jgi:hypothetical protein
LRTPHDAGVLVGKGLRRSVALLADLQPVSAITAEHSATTLPPPSLPRAGIFAPPCRVNGEFPLKTPQVQHDRRQCPAAACSPPGGSATPSARFLARHCPHRPVWVRGVHHVHLVLVPTPHTQVPHVSSGHSSGHRTGRSTARWLAVAALVSAGFRPHGAPPLDACCVVLVPLSTNGSSWSTLSHR